MLRVLLVEDSKLLAERLSELLEQLPGIELVGTADTEREAVAMARAKAVDAIILDLQLREGSGFGVLRTLGMTRPAVIVLTNFFLPSFAERAKEMGVEQFLDKGTDFDQLPAALTSIQSKINHLNS